MKKIVELISEAVKNAFAQKGYDEKYGIVTHSNRPDLCQYQCNGAMAAAKEYKKAPIVIAQEVVEELASDDRIKEITAIMPGFINITLKDEVLAEYLNGMASEKNLDEGEKSPKKIIMTMVFLILPSPFM